MGKIKNLCIQCIPPILIRIVRIFFPKKVIVYNYAIWSGDFQSWEEASKLCTGYDSNEILEKCKNSLLQVKNGDAIYERDSVLFSEIQYSWALLAALQKAAIENNGNLCVLDFGGSLGSSYFQNKEFLSSVQSITWCIVEQENFVACGKENFENENLKFFLSIEDCLTYYKPNVILLSSVLQYLKEPYTWITKIIDLNIEYIIIDRTSFINSENDIITIQNVPESIYNASYPAWFFAKIHFQNLFKLKYKRIANFDNHFTMPQMVEGKNVFWNGIIYKIR